MTHLDFWAGFLLLDLLFDVELFGIFCFFLLLLSSECPLSAPSLLFISVPTVIWNGWVAVHGKGAETAAAGSSADASVLVTLGTDHKHDGSKPFPHHCRRLPVSFTWPHPCPVSVLQVLWRRSAGESSGLPEGPLRSLEEARVHCPLQRAPLLSLGHWDLGPGKSQLCALQLSLLKKHLFPFDFKSNVYIHCKCSTYPWIHSVFLSVLVPVLSRCPIDLRVCWSSLIADTVVKFTVLGSKEKKTKDFQKIKDWIPKFSQRCKA